MLPTKWPEPISFISNKHVNDISQNEIHDDQRGLPLQLVKITKSDRSARYGKNLPSQNAVPFPMDMQ